MKVLSLLQEKGGVGKTTLSTHIGAGLAIRGKRVLIMDFDPQGNATKLLGLTESPRVYDLLVRPETTWKQVISAVNPVHWAGEIEPKGELHMVAGNAETRNIATMVGDVFELRNRFYEIEERYDIVVIDTPPTPSLVHSMIYLATDGLIIPTLCEMLSLDGIGKTRTHMMGLNTQLKGLNLPQVELVGVQPNLYEPNTLAHDKGIEILVKEFGRNIFPSLPKRAAYRKSAWMRQTIFAYGNQSDASAEMWALVGRVEKWMNKKAVVA